MNRFVTVMSFLVLVASAAPHPRAVAAEPGFKESLERLKLLYTPAAPPEGQASAPAPVVIDSTEDGVLIITRRDSLDRSQFNFSAASEQTWRLRPEDLDAKRVAVQDDPAGVFVPVKKGAASLAVERRETKARSATSNSTAEQWTGRERFTTSFVVLPADTPEQAEAAAALIKRIIKTAPKSK